MPRRRLSASRLPAFEVHTFPDTGRFAGQLAEALQVAALPVVLHRFPDGESLVRVRVPVARHAVLVRSLHDPNTKLVETVLAADAARRAGARRVTLVAPYLPYMRQDAIFAPGEPISQRVIGACLSHAFDGVLTVEAHLHRIDHLGAVIAGDARALTAAPVLAQWVQRTGRDCVVVGPDAESEPWVRAIARAAGTPWMIGRKERLHDRTVRIHFPQPPRCRRAVIVDDIASSGATLAAAARAVRRLGVQRVDAAVVHAIFAAGAMRRIRASGVRHLVSCDTIAHRTNAIHCAPLVAAALAEMLR